MQIVSGWLIDRFSVYWIFAGGFFIWSAATALTGLAGGFVNPLRAAPAARHGRICLLSRLFQNNRAGIYGTASRARQRLIDLGSKAGPALGLMIGGVIVSRYGWRPLFVSRRV